MKEKSTKMLRGGSWYGDPRYCRSAARFDNGPGFRPNSIGFRVVCEEGEDPKDKVVRGGFWYNGPWNCRSAVRNINNPGDRHDFIGFRVVCEDHP